jgi:type IV secretory pathway TraG/TraD family ATPase VirD4
MQDDDKRRLAALSFLLFPILGWMLAVQHTETITSPKWRALYALAKVTPTKPYLIAGLLAGFALAAFMTWLLWQLGNTTFKGAYFRKHLRGKKLISGEQLRRQTTEKKEEQITLANIPIPTATETTHFLVCGTTGSGKSVLLREMAYKAFLRGDRMIITDPNGDMLSKFYKEGDIILNPEDGRSAGWSFFNEIRNPYDFRRYTLSLIPRGQTREAEDWYQYGRLLVRETARKLQLMGRASIEELFHWTTAAPADDLGAFLKGTDAASLFVGADKALASARFVLSENLTPHLNMPKGDFSLRSWLEDEQGGNLFITWREDMAEGLKPLISTWTDILCTAILSLPESRTRKLWLFFDELASLGKLPSLEPALTKGRKHGFRVVAGLQSTSQLDVLYGRDEAQTLRACFRSLVVLASAVTDPKTAEDMSTSLGEHEVEREQKSRNSNDKGSGRSHTHQIVRERIVLPSEITSLPDLHGYLALAGDYDIARFLTAPRVFKEGTAAFETKT